MITMRRFKVDAIQTSVRLIQCVGLACFCLAANGEESPSGLQAIERNVREMGIMARLDPEKRDQFIVEIAATLEDLGEKDENGLRSIQGAFQYALLLSCDRGIYETLQPETIEAVDNALETIFAIEDINRDLRWEPLVYAYGFFNRDLTIDEIAKVRNAIDALSDDARQRMHPIYPHTFDAMAKPLSMGPLTDASQTVEALKIIVPMLKDVVMEEAKPGRAFHPPSHAILVIAPLYDRWADAKGPEGDLVRELLGTRAEFVAMLISRLVGGVPTPKDLPQFHYAFYAFDGQYFANALARIDAREAVDALKLSLEVYRENITHPSLISYTQRALVTLGDRNARAALEKSLSSTNNERAVDTLVWICRNAQGEGKAYAEKTLAKQLNCKPEQALDSYLSKQLQAPAP